MNDSIENNNEQNVAKEVFNYKHIISNKTYVKTKIDIPNSPFTKRAIGKVIDTKDNGYVSVISYECLGEDTRYYEIATSDLLKHFEVL